MKPCELLHFTGCALIILASGSASRGVVVRCCGSSDPDKSRTASRCGNYQGRLAPIVLLPRYLGLPGPAAVWTAAEAQCALSLSIRSGNSVTAPETSPRKRQIGRAS